MAERRLRGSREDAEEEEKRLMAEVSEAGSGFERASAETLAQRRMLRTKQGGVSDELKKEPGVFSGIQTVAQASNAVKEMQQNKVDGSKPFVWGSGFYKPEENKPASGFAALTNKPFTGFGNTSASASATTATGAAPTTAATTTTTTTNTNNLFGTVASSWGSVAGWANPFAPRSTESANNGNGKPAGAVKGDDDDDDGEDDEEMDDEDDDNAGDKPGNRSTSSDSVAPARQVIAPTKAGNPFGTASGFNFSFAPPPSSLLSASSSAGAVAPAGSAPSSSTSTSAAASFGSGFAAAVTTTDTSSDNSSSTEKILLQNDQCKLYLLQKDETGATKWTERGSGVLKVLGATEAADGKKIPARIVMRNQATKKAILHCPIDASLKLGKQDEHQLFLSSFAADDIHGGPPPTDAAQSFLLRSAKTAPATVITEFVKVVQQNLN